MMTILQLQNLLYDIFLLMFQFHCYSFMVDMAAGAATVLTKFYAALEQMGFDQAQRDAIINSS